MTKKDKKNKGRIVFLLAMIVTAITFFVLKPVTKNDFINWDDPRYLLENKMVRSLDKENIKAIFVDQENYQSSYVPLTILSFAIEYHISKYDPSTYHTTNLIIHLLNTLLVFWLFFLLSTKPEVAFLCALLFGIHPMHVESVAWVTERKDVLFSFFFLLSLISYVYFLRALRSRWIFYGIALILFFTALLAKSAAASLPLIIILIDYLKYRKVNIKSIIEKIPFLFLSVWWGMVTMGATKALSSPEDFNILERVMLASRNVFVYIGKMIMPIKQSLYYPFPNYDNGYLPVEFYIAPFALLAIIFIIYKYARSNRKLIFGLSFFLFTIALMLQFIPVGPNLITERYTYISYIGLFYILGEGYSYIHRNTSKTIKNIRPFIQVALGIYLIIFMYRTYQRVEVWQNSETVWSDVLDNFTTDAEPYYNRAAFYMEKKNYNKALYDLNNALEVKPNHVGAYNNKGLVLYHRGKYKKAIKHFDHAIKLDSTYAKAYTNRGMAWGRLGSLDKTIEDCNKAIAIDPTIADSYANKGIALAMRGEYKEAIKNFNKAIERKPFDEKYYFNRGMALASQGNRKAGCKDLYKARKMGYPNVENTINKYCKE